VNFAYYTLGDPRKTQFGHSCSGSLTTNGALGIPDRKHVRVRYG